MRTHYDAIYLSPHLDDAALSCGGQIYEQTAVGHSVLIVTIMAGDPPPQGPFSAFVQELHARWRLVENAAAARRAEDVQACQILGAAYEHWSIPDCVYRTHPVNGRPLYPTWEDVIAAVHPAEEGLIGQLAQQIGRLPPAGQVYTPLAAGGHADHRITRAAAERRFGAKLLYYEDYPYAAERDALTAVIPSGDPSWQWRVVPLSAASLAAKITAVAAYTSQVSTFFAGQADLEQKITAYTAPGGGERVWQRRVGSGVV